VQPAGGLLSPTWYPSALQEHWFAIRQVGGEWWNFNSLYPAPEHLSAFYLTAYLDSLKQQCYTIFVVRGQLPASPAATGAELDGPGKWWDPDEVGGWAADIWIFVHGSIVTIYTIFVVRGQLPAIPAASCAELDGPGKWWDPDEVGGWGAAAALVLPCWGKRVVDESTAQPQPTPSGCCCCRYLSLVVGSIVTCCTCMWSGGSCLLALLPHALSWTSLASGGTQMRWDGVRLQIYTCLWRLAVL
jgi:hypothetical protein